MKNLFPFIQDETISDLWSITDMEDSFYSTKFSSTTNRETNSLNQKKNDYYDNDNKEEKIENLKISMKKEILDSEFSVEDACDLIKKVFSAASEREISIGDGVDIWIVRNNDNIDDIDYSSINNDNDNNNNKNNNNIIINSKIEDIDSISNSKENVALTSEGNYWNSKKLIKKSDFRNGLFRIEKRFFNLAKS